MRLSKLKLAGFKSFVDPTTILAPGQLVGIVGPNGCGKSNVIDAVRWVLGESRASALRGESMQDVIFNGSTTRKPVQRASVELIFDNAEGRAAGQWSQYAEIAVKRVVDRAGGSDYFINNVRVRRKDVIDLFLGTGLGPRAYAIIEQGMISRVIEARPEDVRAFLEEAAGITKYKERRRETEGRLADARDNLARIEDIRAELGSQIDRLAAQAEVARTYKELADSLNERQRLLWVFKRESAATEKARNAEGIATSGTTLEAETERLRILEDQLLVARERHTRLSDVVGVAQGDLYAISAEVSRIENELKSLRDTRSRLSQRIDQLTMSEAQWRERSTQLATERERWAELREVATVRLEQAQDELAIAQEALPEVEDTYRRAQEEQDRLRRELAQAEQQMRVDDTRRQASLRAIEALTARRQRLEADLAQLPTADPGDAEAIELAVETLAGQLEDAEAEQTAQQGAHIQSQGALRAAQEAERRAARAVTEKRARLDALEALQAKLRDAGDMGAWLREAGLSDLQPLWQHITVDAGWELALEAVLRERLAARGPLARMPESIHGKSVPSTVVLTREGAPAPAQRPAFAGTPLVSRLRCANAAAAGILEHWLAGAYAVDDIQPWTDRAAQLPDDVVLVAQNGAVLSARELTLFAPDARTHGALERQREIESLSAELATLEEEQAACAERATEAEEALAAAANALTTVRGRIGQLQQQMHAAQLEVVRVQQEKARFEERRAQLRREGDEISIAEETENNHLMEAEAGRELHQQRADELAERLHAAQQTVAQGEQAQRAQREHVQAFLRAVQEAEFSLRECAGKLDDISRNDTLTAEQISRGEVELAQLIAERDGLDEETLQVSLSTALDLRDSREAALAARRDEMERASNTLREQDAERLRCERALDPLREQLNALRLAHQAAELAHQQACERLEEMQASDAQYAPEELAQVKELTLTREVARINREIGELGAVNLAALSELTTATERKGFLDAQNDDLTQAIETLEDAIRRIDRETREQLMETYNTVNRHFGELFPRLFGGGEAELLLTGDEILDAGVQIIARPPGKKNSSIHLLSGGEKALTAIALVFSMFQLNPAPFCMLDEVDAPLDDANTERYCEMVKHMSSVTQFVFISHSKITMEMAQQLIGVTMQEQGVSRVVEVDMDEALRLAQPEAA